MKPMKKRTDQLLAAYADGGLAPDEAAEVEALLAESPEARAELEAIRRLLADARAGEDDHAEPDWDAMARDIHRACDQAPPPRFGWLRPRRVFAIGALAAAATAAVLFVALGRDGGGGGNGDDRATRAAIDPTTPPVAVTPPAADQLDPPGEEALPDLREPEVDELSDDELHDLDDELATGDLGDDGFIADLLAGEADDPGFDVFEDHPLTADELAKELPPDAIEKLDRFLAEVSAG